MTSRPQTAVFTVLLVFCAVLPARSQESIALITQADTAYSKREDIAQAKIALIIYERVSGADPTHAVECNWKASRAAWWLAENTLDDDEQLNWYLEAIEYAKKAAAIDPNSVEAHFWLGATQGSYAKAKGVFKSLSLIKPIRHEMEEVIRLNEHYLNGAAYRVLGVVDFKVPRMMGGNIKRAKEELDKSRSMGESDPFLFYDYVQYYKVMGDITQAKIHLDKLRKLQVAPELLPEHKMLLRKAEDLLS